MGRFKFAIAEESGRAHAGVNPYRYVHNSGEGSCYKPLFTVTPNRDVWNAIISQVTRKEACNGVLCVLIANNFNYGYQLNIIDSECT